ncbi:MAG: TIR domain-containing protein [Ferruginibacter sp.]
MKPKIFIGSSVEGLSVAYSIQQNLTHDADVTVWDQGVFELSRTTIESLIEALAKSDFGIFVFNQDDIVKIRDQDTKSVRDNVLFEFGLFIGKLGRDRVFFIIPDNTELHLPTDLIGVTPGKYDPYREDNSLQAATGPVCHQIRLQIKKLGILSTNEETSKAPDEKSTFRDKESTWIDLFVKREYLKAKEILEKSTSTETKPDEAVENLVWLGYCDFKINETHGISVLTTLLLDHPDNKLVYENVARIYLWEDYLDKAIQILENAILKFNNDPALIILLSECYKKTDGLDKALNYLLGESPEENIDLALEIWTIHFNQKEYSKAREIIHKAYLNYPNKEKIRFNYARVAIELDENEIALYFLTSLTKEFSENYSYWGYFSNCYVALDLYDMGMIACKKGLELSKDNAEWITANIGNMLKNKGFYTEGIEYLETALGLDKSSQYAHDRLASAIKSKNEEAEKATLLFDEGRKLLRQYTPGEQVK